MLLNDSMVDIRKWAIERGLEKAAPMAQLVKLAEELGELSEGYLKQNDKLFKDSIGDLFVALVVLCLQTNVLLPSCVLGAYAEIKNRHGQMINGTYVKDADLGDEK